MDVLVDSSVWVSFFRGMKGEETVAKALDYLLAGDGVVVNEVIKTEVMPKYGQTNKQAFIDVAESSLCDEGPVGGRRVRT